MRFLYLFLFLSTFVWQADYAEYKKDEFGFIIKQYKQNGIHACGFSLPTSYQTYLEERKEEPC